MKTGITKVCKVCGEEKDLAEFYRHKATIDRRQPLCKECDKARSKKQYESDLPRNRAKRRKWQDDNPHVHLNHCRDYRERKRKENVNA